MARGAIRNVMMALALGTTLAGAATAVPASAQMFRDGYEFLKAVKDRDGDAATEFLNEPGSTIINTRDISSGETALHVVTARRDLVWLRFLLQKGANPNLRDKQGTAPLQLAVRLGFVEGVEALIDQGAQVDVNDAAGETPLIAAVHRRDVPMVRLLLANGANMDRTDNSGRTARDYANLLKGNSTVSDEFDKATADRAGKPAAKDYGPSL